MKTTGFWLLLFVLGAWVFGSPLVFKSEDFLPRFSAALAAGQMLTGTGTVSMDFLRSSDYEPASYLSLKIGSGGFLGAAQTFFLNED